MVEKKHSQASGLSWDKIYGFGPGSGRHLTGQAFVRPAWNLAWPEERQSKSQKQAGAALKLL